VEVGRKGMAWGSGLHPEPANLKKEGDGKSPAGVFSLGTAFGFTPFQDLKLPYLLIKEGIQAVDDPRSRYYNTIVEAMQTEDIDWKSAEIMTAYPDLYKWGIVVNHNVSPTIPQDGSCIFIHVWQGNGEGTAGCTTMAEKDLCEILTWLDPSKVPLLIQFPRFIYEDWQKKHAFFPTVAGLF
jgi:D-alanyl-D-alanine dipeptidase